MYNVALVGCGYWGPNLARNLASLPDCRLAVVCDRDPARLASVAGAYPGMAATTDFNDVLSDSSIDAVFIATPVRTHFTLALRALEAGKHVFLEKPMAASVAECEALLEASLRRSLTLMVGHTFIYSSPVRKMKELIDTGAIGDVLHISSRRLNLGLFRPDINVVWDLAPHDISIVLYLLGREPSSVNCQGRAHIRTGIEDVAGLSLRFPDGNMATIQVSWIDPRKVREFTIVGSRKMIVYDDLEPLEKVKIYDKSVEAPAPTGSFADFQYSYHYGDVISPYLKLVEPLRAECQHFLDCIGSGKAPETGGEDGLRVTRVLEASSRSLAQGGSSVPLAVTEQAAVGQPA
jgi:predicted dehydrogenase